MKRHGRHQQHEHGIVFTADAVVEVFAVVIEFGNAFVASTAMLRPGAHIRITDHAVVFIELSVDFLDVTLSQ